MNLAELVRRAESLGVELHACAQPVAGGPVVGMEPDVPVSPASVMKVQLCLAVQDAIATGRLDGSRPIQVPVGVRTPGPVGLSLMHDPVTMSAQDLVVLALTISDNVATDALIGLVGLEAVNDLTARLGLSRTRIVSDLRTMLDQIAQEAGFADYPTLVAYEPSDATAGPSGVEIVRRIRLSTPMNPLRGTSTTAGESVQLLRGIWLGQAAAARACARIRDVMARQLSQQRIASGFAPPDTVAAKSGALLGIARNEVGVVTYPDGAAYAVAVFTRTCSDRSAPAAEVDALIGATAKELVFRLRV